MRSEAWRPAAAVRNRSPREARDPALQALRPGCEELAVTDPAQMPGREARPRSPKPPRWSAERRASRVMANYQPLALDATRCGLHNHLKVRTIDVLALDLAGCYFTPLLRTLTGHGAMPKPRAATL